MGYKSLMLVYQERTATAIPRDHGTVQNTIPAVQEISLRMVSYV
ncbi:MAG: hypothetical protein Ct9H300mP28_34830 [Pseudomonadota bacterium]|nr:MAG: hypothetical protein Ct9H300mP28_34830 [Pseudomonadota bacterium]